MDKIGPSQRNNNQKQQNPKLINGEKDGIDSLMEIEKQANEQKRRDKMTKSENEKNQKGKKYENHLKSDQKLLKISMMETVVEIKAGVFRDPISNNISISERKRARCVLRSPEKLKY